MTVDDKDRTIARLRRDLLRERAARMDAERIADLALRQNQARSNSDAVMRKVQAAVIVERPATETLHEVLGILCREMGWAVGHAFLVHDGTSEPVSTGVWWEASPRDARPLQDATLHAPIRQGEGFLGRAWAAREPDWVDDAVPGEGFPRRQIVATTGMRSGIAFPVLVGADVVGLVELLCRFPKELDDYVVALCGECGYVLGPLFDRMLDEVAGARTA